MPVARDFSNFSCYNILKLSEELTLGNLFSCSSRTQRGTPSPEELTPYNGGYGNFYWTDSQEELRRDNINTRASRGVKPTDRSSPNARTKENRDLSVQSHISNYKRRFPYEESEQKRWNFWSIRGQASQGIGFEINTLIQRSAKK